MGNSHARESGHTMCVVDALVNYLTVRFSRKEIRTFGRQIITCYRDGHQPLSFIALAAMLMSANIALPKQVIVHGFVNDEME